MRTATITAKGQVTIPKDVREELGLKEHDKVVFVPLGDKCIIRPIRRMSLDELQDMVAGNVGNFPGRKAEREAARRHVAEEVRQNYSCE